MPNRDETEALASEKGVAGLTSLEESDNSTAPACTYHEESSYKRIASRTEYVRTVKLLSDKVLYFNTEKRIRPNLDERPSFIIRRFEQSDLDAVMAINATCLPENYSASFFLDVCAKFPEGFLVAINDNRVVGYIMCRLERGFSETSRFRFMKKGHVISIAVLPEYRRKGMAKGLVNEAMRSLAERGSEECFLEVRVSNKSAQELYSKLGFKETRTIPFYYHNGEDAVVMSRPL
jgi:ribosomal-protein-alanine N-acetyltransferase